MINPNIPRVASQLDKTTKMSTTMDYRSLPDIVCSVNRLPRLSLYIPRLIVHSSLNLSKHINLHSCKSIGVSKIIPSAIILDPKPCIRMNSTSVGWSTSVCSLIRALS